MLGISLNPIDWVKDAANDVVGSAFDFLANWISDGLSWLAGELMDTIVGAGSVDLSERFGQLGGPAGIVLWLGLVSVVVGLIAQLTSVAWRSDAGMVQMTDSLLDLPVTLLMMFGLPALGVTILELFDAAAAAIGQNAMANGFGKNLTLEGGVPGVMRSLVGILMMLALVVLYIEQLIRGHLATVLIVLGPFSIAMRSWAPARVVFRDGAAVLCVGHHAAGDDDLLVGCVAALLGHGRSGHLPWARGARRLGVGDLVAVHRQQALSGGRRDVGGDRRGRGCRCGDGCQASGRWGNGRSRWWCWRRCSSCGACWEWSCRPARRS